MENDLVGKKHLFADGMVIEVMQIKLKEVDGLNQPYVTYHVYNSASIPRKLTMTLTEFINTFGHLFES